jgi:methanethiol S-methyltransferase
MIEFTLVFTIWALLHSITASRRFKARVRGLMGERPFTGLYRLLYNIFSFITILPVFYVLLTAVPPTIIWQIPAPWAYGLTAVRLLALVGLLISFLQTDVWDFIGLRQAVRFWQKAEGDGPPPRLVTSGTYALVRHPLYFFSMLFLWVSPVMLLPNFLFNLLASGYFWAGSRVEERRLAAYFGEAYESYRRRVPALVPFPKINKAGS